MSLRPTSSTPRLRLCCEDVCVLCTETMLKDGRTHLCRVTTDTCCLQQFYGLQVPEARLSGESRTDRVCSALAFASPSLHSTPFGIL